MSALLLPALPRRSPGELREALDRVIEAALSQAAPGPGVRSLSGQLPSKQRLLEGQNALRTDPQSAEAAAQRALLECALVVASADELTHDERAALESLFQHVLGDPDVGGLLSMLQRDLEARALEDSLSQIAQQLVSFEEREQALSFAVLAAIADRELAEAEADRLLDLGARFGFGVGEVQRLVDRVAKALKSALLTTDARA